MILPIYVYGQSALRKPTEEIGPDYEGLKELIDNMYETMFKASGVGRAAPLIVLSIRVFVVDADVMGDEYEECKGFKRAFINPVIINKSQETVSMEEGCLSLPGISESVSRAQWIEIRYQDENLQEHEERIEGYAARVFQHEYDHLEGHVFTDRISPLRRQLIKNKLNNIAKGKTACRYKTK